LQRFYEWCECAESDADRRFLRRLNDDRNLGLGDASKQVLHVMGLGERGEMV